MYRFLLLLALGTSPLLASAQAPTTQSTTTAGLRDGAYRKQGVTMRLKGGQATRLLKPLTLTDGSVINPNGLLVRKNGTRQRLPEGQAVNMQGVVVNLRDDMKSETAIVEQLQQVTGSTGETRFVIPPTPASAATVQQLQLLERRVALLQQLSDKLAERTTEATPAGAKAAQYDEQLRTIDAQLRR
jgi:hypothetical protein